MSKANSVPVLLVKVRVWVSPCPNDPRAITTAGLREMEGGMDWSAPCCTRGGAGRLWGAGAGFWANAHNAPRNILATSFGISKTLVTTSLQKKSLLPLKFLGEGN